MIDLAPCAEPAYLAWMDEAAPDTRQRLLAAAERLFRTQGYSGTGLKELTALAEAPWGSLYHFFPGGKTQLGVEALRYGGQLYVAGIHATFAHFADPTIAAERLFLSEIKPLSQSDYRDGCPIASTTLDIASVNEALRAACDEVFADWQAAIAAGLRAGGAPSAVADDLACFILSTLEGAIVLARAAKDPAPLRRSARYVRAAVEAEARAWVRA